MNRPLRTEKMILPWPNSDNDHHTPVPCRIRAKTKGPVPTSGRKIPFSSSKWSAKMILTKSARDYRTLVKMVVGFRHPNKVWDCPVGMNIDLFPPRNACDTNNFWKSLQDALTHAGVWSDDRIVKKSRAIMHRADGNPRVEVEIWELRDQPE